MKLGVVIQGPLISFGQGPNNSIGGFDTRETILKNINAMGDICYIVSTWTPTNPEEQKIFDALDEEGVCIMHHHTPLEFDPDHRYKQHLGILRGGGNFCCQNMGR